MKKLSKTKLAIRAESIRNLANQELAGAQGGKPPQSQSGCAGDCDTFKCGSNVCPSTHHIAC
jgi:hypothetical protein